MNALVLSLYSVCILALLPSFSHCRYSDHFHITWGDENIKSTNHDHVWQMALTNVTASGFASIKSYMFGSFSMYIKLVPKDSAGTVTAYYFYSGTENRDEVDFEFLGNETGQPYALQTNVFWNGTGGREQRTFLWFDPTKAYHNYTVVWNPQQLLIMVDGIPIRVVPNLESKGIPFLNKQPMRIYASIWDGSSWATRGGWVKINWAKSPFIAAFGKYEYDACVPGKSSCAKNKWWNTPQFHNLTSEQAAQYQWAQQNYMIYNYCTDRGRYPEIPPECPQ